MNNLNNLLSNKNKFILTHPSIIIPQVNYNSTKIIKYEKKKNRCFHVKCKKKLKLTDIICDCKNTYCSLHRLPHEHNCSYLKVKQQLNKEKILDGKCINDKI